MSTNRPRIVRRADKGLIIAGTRVTLYALLDYLNAEWSHEAIRDWLSLTDEQLGVALAYLGAHRAEVEAEYAEVVRAANERRRYWEQRAREHLASAPVSPPSPEKAELYARLARQRAQTICTLVHAHADAP